MSTTLRAALIAALFALAAIPSARAQAPADPPHVLEARERVRRGQALFDRGDFDAALTEFESSYEMIGEHPRRYLVLYNIALCHERRFRYDVAIATYRRYLDEGGAAVTNAGEVQEIVRTLESLVGTLRVEIGAGSSAEVWLDERRIGDAPGQVQIPAGLHEVELRSAGYFPERRTVQLPAGGERTLQIAMRPIDAFRGLPTEAFWITASVAAATLATGAALGAASLVMSGSLDARLADPIDRWNVTQSEIDQVNTLSLAADVLFIGGALFAVTSVVLALITDWNGARSTENAGGTPWLVRF